MNDIKVMEVQSEALSTMKLPFKKQVHLKIKHEGRVYHLLIYLRKRTDQLLVISNGAIDPKKKKPPVFMRSSWMDELPGSLIFIDDPTLHGTDLKLGWGQGTKEAFALEEIVLFIDVLSKNLNYDREHIYFYGSSAGGFMSMMYATMLKGTSAVVNNPQSNVLKYYSSSVDPLLNHVYHTNDKESVLEIYKNRLDVFEAFKYYGHTPRIHYFQNERCSHDVKNHLMPLVKGMIESGMDMDKFYVHRYFDREAGHGPLSKEGTVRMLKAVLSGNLDYHI